jgi:hypothetical protein
MDGSSKNEKGVVLIISMMVIAVVSVLTGVYMSGLVTEKRSYDTERNVVQALNLAEAAGNLAFAEMNKRFPHDLNMKLGNVNANTLGSYVDSGDSLKFLRDYGYATGATKFSQSGSIASLELLLPDTLIAGASASGNGTGSATITVEENGNPVKDSADGPFRFRYKYSIVATGRIRVSLGADNIANTGDDVYLTKSIAFAPNTFTIIVRHDNFAKFALFTSHHRTPSNTTVWFTDDTNFYGPVHTNERFSFAKNPSAHFTDLISQHQNTARYYNNGNSIYLDSDRNGIRDVPVFDAGFQRGADLINLPSSISQTELRNQALGTMPVPGASNRGVFLPNKDGALTGGIYINGNSGQSSDDATIQLAVDGSNNPQYTISQTLSGVTHTTVISVDYSANRTTYQYDGETPVEYTGVPDGVDDEGTLIYANDDIRSLSGTVQRDTKITVSSERDICITNDIVYQDHYDANADDNPNPDGRLCATGYNNLMGILSWGGDVRIVTPSNVEKDIEIHGIVMAHNGVFTVDNYNSGVCRGTATLLGGVITDFYGAFGTFSGSSRTGYGRDFIYDSRVLEGISPPYFPYMSNYTSNIDPPNVFRTRTSWREF